MQTFYPIAFSSYRVAKRVGTIWDTAEGSSKLRVTAVKALLPILSIFAEWLTVHQPFLLTAESSADEKGSSETEEVESSAGPSSSSAGAGAPAMSARGAIAANAETLRAESRARSSLRSALSALKDPVEICIRAHAGPSGSESKKVDVRGKPLREHIELRGFLPLAAQYEVRYYRYSDHNFSLIWLLLAVENRCEGVILRTAI
jgi:hypothetical protein